MNTLYTSPLQTFPRPLKPKTDELLSSWMVRLALAHKTKVHTFYRQYLPGIEIWNRDIDRSCPKIVLKRLAELTATDITKVRDTTLKSFEGRLYLCHNENGSSRWILNYGVRHRERNRNGLVYCPQCLKNDGESPYFRKTWRLAFSVCCAECGIFLHDCCPDCRKPVSYFRLGIGKAINLTRSICICPYCGYDLRDSERIKCSIMLLRCQKMLMRILEEGWKRDVFYPHLFFDVFHILLNVLRSHRKEGIRLRNYFTRNWPDLAFKENPARHLFENLSIQVRTVLILEAYWILTEWPERFTATMGYLGFYSSSLLRCSTEVPFWYQSFVEANFFQSNTNRQFVGIHTIYKRFGRNGNRSTILLSLGQRSILSSDKYLFCPSCYSDNIFKYGKGRGKQHYMCKYCHRKFTNGPSLIFSKVETTRH